jgi:hypothetical protein
MPVGHLSEQIPFKILYPVLHLVHWSLLRAHYMQFFTAQASHLYTLEMLGASKEARLSKPNFVSAAAAVCSSGEPTYVVLYEYLNSNTSEIILWYSGQPLVQIEAMTYEGTTAAAS